MSDFFADQEKTVQHEVIEKGSAQQVKANLHLQAGSAAIQGGASALMVAAFEYNDEDLKPVVSYEEHSEQGRLSVEQPPLLSGWKNIFRLRDFHNEWDISLNDEIPLELAVKLNAGRLDADFNTLNLESLKLQVNSGKADLSLVGSYPQMRRAQLDMNAGKLHAAVSGAFPQLDVLRVTLNAGDAFLDLSGSWEHALNIRIEVNAGRLQLRLPETVGVAIKPKVNLGKFDAGQLQEQGSLYTNSQYDEEAADSGLKIKATISVGRLAIVD